MEIEKQWQAGSDQMQLLNTPKSSEEEGRQLQTGGTNGGY